MIVLEPPSSGTFPAINRTALSRFLKRAQTATKLSGEVTVLLADDARLKELNRAFRMKNKATDVLSFPAAPMSGDHAGEGVAGDLAISVETAARQAAEHGHDLEDELRILTLHGLLHLAGYDHEVDKGEMRALESDLRAKLKLPVGLIERVEAPKKKTTKKKTAKKSAVKTVVRKTAAKKAAKKATNKRSAR